jgi:hypothetical protein
LQSADPKHPNRHVLLAPHSKGRWVRIVLGRWDDEPSAVISAHTTDVGRALRLISSSAVKIDRWPGRPTS